MKVDEEALIAYLVGSLDPGETADVHAWLAEGDGRDARLNALRPRLSPLEVPPPRWRVPPAGHGWPAELRRGASLGSVQARVGGWFRVTAAALGDAADREVFVLRNVDEDWVIEAPAALDERVPLDALATEAEGDHRVDLRALGPAGTQRWMIAFPRRADIESLSWPPDDWLRRQIRTNQLPVVSVTVDIATD